MKIELKGGKFVLVSKRDFADLSKYKWHLVFNKRRNGYYVARSAYENRKTITVYMHRQITICPKGLVVDHRDNDGLNNRRSNLRVCDYKQNNSNRELHRNQAIRFKGVIKCGNRWGARISNENKQVWLGMFSSMELAARVYDRAARKLRGPFAKTNFNTGSEPVEDEK